METTSRGSPTEPSAVPGSAETPAACPCPSAGDLLAAYDAERPDADQRAIRRHTAQCPACRGQLDCVLTILRAARRADPWGWWRHRVRKVLLLVLLAMATGPHQLSEADELLAEAVAAERTSPAPTRVSVRVLPTEGPVVPGCEPSLVLLDATEALAPRIRSPGARQLVQSFTLLPLRASARIYRTWRGQGVWWSHATTVQRDARYLTVRTRASTGPIRSAELILRPHTRTVVALRLLGEDCRVDIRAVEGSGRARREPALLSEP